jgi:crossover junction endodeoxyribonuclease RuvC
MVILGVDPGSHRTGYGLISAGPSRVSLLAMGVIKPPASASLGERLRAIHETVVTLIQEHAPAVLAVEDLFHSVNARSALTLGHVRGVILLAGAQAGLPIAAYAPATVKLQVAGTGRADKEQVAFMVRRTLGLAETVAAGDATDALAVAVCHARLAPPTELRA